MLIATAEAILLWFLYIFMRIYSKDFLGFKTQ